MNLVHQVYWVELFSLCKGEIQVGPICNIHGIPVLFSQRMFLERYGIERVARVWRLDGLVHTNHS